MRSLMRGSLMCFSVRHVNVVTRGHEKGSSCRVREEPEVFRFRTGPFRDAVAPPSRAAARQRVADLFGPGDLLVDAGGSWASLAHRPGRRSVNTQGYQRGSIHENRHTFPARCGQGDLRT